MRCEVGGDCSAASRRRSTPSPPAHSKRPHRSAPIPLTGLRRAVTRRTDTRTGLPRENGIGVISGVRGQFTASERYTPERGGANPQGWPVKCLSEACGANHGVGSEDGRRLRPLYRRSGASLNLSHPWVDSTAAIDDAVDAKFLSLEKSLDDWTTSSSGVVPTARQCVDGLPRNTQVSDRKRMPRPPMARPNSAPGLPEGYQRPRSCLSSALTMGEPATENPNRSLTQDQIDSFRRDGFVVIGKLLEDSEMTCGRANAP